MTRRELALGAALVLVLAGGAQMGMHGTLIIR
jgi:hypothetical protein